VRRGVHDAEEAARFLAPKLTYLSDPDELPQMDTAVARIEQSIRLKEKIVIFGDYDVDGISSTCLLLDFFRLIGFPVEYRLPHRLNEGYGLREHTVREFGDKGVDLLITVDNGSSSREEIRLADELGIDVVVTDHHMPSKDLPEPVALVNPWVEPDATSFREFAGVGVTFKLVWGLCQRLSRAKKLSEEFREFLLDSLALVALGTISDVVPLRGENRVLVKFGLIALRNSRRPGIRKLVEAALRTGRGGGTRSDAVEARDVGFGLGPRLNAAGRLGCADQAIRLLTTESEETAAELLDVLERENQRRRAIEAEIHADARGRVLEEGLGREKAIVLGDPSWHPGVIGIVASRLVEEFFRPTVLVALGERCRGSVRSIPGVHITDALSRCGECLLSFGGHAVAAGLEIEASQLGTLRRMLNETIDLPIEEMVPEIEVDLRVDLSKVTGGFLDELSRLAPHGAGNPEPLLAAGDLEVVGQPRLMGAKGQHLSFFVRAQGRAFRAVAFGKGNYYDKIRTNDSRVSLLFRPTWNSWQGRREIELNVRELVVG